MTPQDYLQHLIDVATGEKWKVPPQKEYAWAAAKAYAAMDPYRLADLPELLKTEMLLRQKS